MKAVSTLAAGSGGAAVWSGRLRSVLDVRFLALLSSLATYALIVLGGTVRATGSGLACPDWPSCHGQLIPPLETNVLIEFSHRLAAVVVGLLIVSTAGSAWAWHRDKHAVLTGATAAVAVLVVQAGVGGVTVNMELPDTVVAVHLFIALSLLAVLIATAVAAFRAADAALANGRVARNGRGLPLLPVLAAAATMALILTGSYVANSGAGLAYPDWPLFNHKLISAGGRLADLHYTHRLTALVVGALVAAVAVRAWRDRLRSPGLLTIASLAVILYVAQVFVGASNIWLELATSVRIVHLALASALWALLVLAAVWTYSERQGA
ncbi:MAG TPA: COX15/CtaA family protein [Dehalococcoidia bacterium]|nr:COX15/CtaA family protein [Dehalococcoidia bacterium]